MRERSMVIGNRKKRSFSDASENGGEMIKMTYTIISFIVFNTAIFPVNPVAHLSHNFVIDARNIISLKVREGKQWLDAKICVAQLGRVGGFSGRGSPWMNEVHALGGFPRTWPAS